MQRFASVGARSIRFYIVQNGKTICFERYHGLRAPDCTGRLLISSLSALQAAATHPKDKLQRKRRLTYTKGELIAGRGHPCCVCCCRATTTARAGSVAPPLHTARAVGSEDLSADSRRPHRRQPTVRRPAAPPPSCAATPDTSRRAAPA